MHDGKISVFSAGEGKGTRDINVITLTTRHSGTDLKVFYVGCSFTVEIPMQRVSTEIRLSDESLPRELDLMPFILAQRPRVASVDKEEIITIHHVDHSALSAQTVESSLLLLTDLKMTILVVDDSRLNRKMLIRCLQIDGETGREIRLDQNASHRKYMLNQASITT